jgi:hypothetical protein
MRAPASPGSESDGFHAGSRIYVDPRPAKRRGQDRIWIHMRQVDDGKPWRLGPVLAYPHVADIRFEREGKTKKS